MTEYNYDLLVIGSGPGGQSTALHAWVEAYLPGAGWVGLGPTRECSPASGSHEAFETVFYYHNRVTRLGKGTHDTNPAVNTPR